jgi:HicB family
MRQLTLRVPEELAERLKGAARDHEESVNGYAVKVLSAAVDPDLASDEITGLKERLARAGLLLTPKRLPTKRPSARALWRKARTGELEDATAGILVSAFELDFHGDPDSGSTQPDLMPTGITHPGRAVPASGML